MNFLMSLYSSRVLNFFGFGMNKTPLLTVVVMDGSVASNTISLFSLFLFTLHLYDSIKSMHQYIHVCSFYMFFFSFLWLSVSCLSSSFFVLSSLASLTVARPPPSPCGGLYVF